MSDLIQVVNSPDEIARAAVRLREVAFNKHLSGCAVLELFERWSAALQGNGMESVPGTAFLRLWLRQGTLEPILERELGQETLNGGWPSYEFGDGSTGFSGIMRKTNGASSVVLSSRSIADTPNCMFAEFQDSLNGYQQDSYELVDPEDIALTGQTTTATLMALGLPQFDQASRILKFNLEKSILGQSRLEQPSRHILSRTTLRNQHG